MNERKLKIFYKVAQKLNMTEAAEELYISQPAISQTIKELEEEFGFKLFDRLGKKLYLTPAGEEMLGYARRILNLVDEMHSKVADMKALTKGTLRVGASTTIGIYILADIVGQFNRLYEGINTTIIIENTKIIADMILENAIDFAFVEGPVHSDELVVKKFCDDELVIIVAPDHKWAGKDYVSVEDMLGQKIIMREKGSGTREVFEVAMLSNNKKYSVALEMGNTEAIKKAVEAGLGVSCISRRAVQRESDAGLLSIVRFKEIEIGRTLNLIYHKDKALSALSNKFIEFCHSSVYA